MYSKTILQVICFAAISLIFILSANVNANTSAQIELSGSVPEYMYLESSAANFDFGDPSQDDINDAVVSEVSIYSNAPNGWTLKLANENPDFELRSETDFIAYSLKYDGKAIRHGDSMVLDSDNGTNGATRDLKKDLSVSLKADKELNAGTYTDRLILEIVAN